MKAEALFRWVTAIFITGAAVSELTRQPSVMTGLQALGYPPTLVWILGPAKLAAVAALILRPRTDVARAAWLGLWINLAGAVASKRGCIRTPADMKGLKIRSAGPTFAEMWQAAGASIVNIPSNEVYNALQTGVADATDTSTGSFVSFRIHEQVKCVTAPGENALWFMYEPVLMSKRSFARLNKAQQDALLAASRKSEAYFDAESKGLDTQMVETFRKAGVEVVTMSGAEYDAWVKLAQESSYKRFAAEVSDGRKLIDAALAVK